MRVLVSSLLTSLVLSSAAFAQDLFLRNGTLVDPATSEARVANLLIVDGSIAGYPSEPPSDFTGDVVDVTDRWIIPGLNDLHTHSYGNMGPGGAFEFVGTAIVAKRHLYCGVTGFLDLFGDEQGLYSLRQRQRQGGVDGSDLFASLSCLTATEGHCTEYGVPTRTMDSAEEARAVVADLATKSPDVIKIVYSPSGRMPSIDKETLAAAVGTATEHGIKTVIHIGTWQDAADAVEAGASAITHVPTDGPVPADLVQTMAASGVAHIPTLAVETDFRHFVLDGGVLEDPLAGEVTAEAILASYRSEATVQHATDMAGEATERESLIFSSVKALADGGVTMLTGTDSGNWGTLQGFSMHRELEKMVAAGLTPWQALAAATTEAGAFLGRDWGLAVGDEANLVVLEASPIDDIGNTRRIHSVIHHGKIVDRAALLSSEAP